MRNTAQYCLILNTNILLQVRRKGPPPQKQIQKPQMQIQIRCHQDGDLTQNEVENRNRSYLWNRWSDIVSSPASHHHSSPINITQWETRQNGWWGWTITFNHTLARLPSPPSFVTFKMMKLHDLQFLLPFFDTCDLKDLIDYSLWKCTSSNV